MNKETEEAYKNLMIAIQKNIENILDPTMDEAVFLCKISACVVNGCASLIAVDEEDYHIFSEAVEMEANEGSTLYFENFAKEI